MVFLTKYIFKTGFLHKLPLSLSVKTNRTNGTFGFLPTHVPFKKTKRAIFFQRN